MRNLTPWHPAHIRQHRDITPTVHEFEIRPEGGVRPWTVGSHLDLRVQIDGRDETRSYSLTGTPHEDGADAVYRIAVKRAQPGRGGSRHRGSLEPFWVELPRHGLTLQVPAERSLLDVLNDAGAETRFDCRRGECGLCAMDIVPVQGSIDHTRRVSQRARAASGPAPVRLRLALDTAYRPD